MSAETAVSTGGYANYTSFNDVLETVLFPGVPKELTEELFLLCRSSLGGLRRV